jgi:TPR repeat protein
MAYPGTAFVYIHEDNSNKGSFSGGSMSARSACLFLFVLILLPVMPATSAGLEDADERLFKVQLAMAEKGDTRAQYYLGEMHEQGLGTKQDVDEAFKWYSKAAEQGDSLALRKLAHRKEIITEIKQDQEAEKLKSPVTATKPGNSGATAKSVAPSIPVAVARTDQAQLEQDRIKTAEREKRRAMVRAMILERIRNPVGELFE